MSEKQEYMTAIDWTHLAAFEEEWVALDKQSTVVDHSKIFAELRKRLGDGTKDFSYFFVPLTKQGFSSLP